MSAPEKGMGPFDLFGPELNDPNVAAAWEALRQHGRARAGRPRKDSPHPTLAQLGLSKWTARRAQVLASITLTDEAMRAMACRTKGHSLTALIEHRSRVGRRRNPLFRAWRVAMQAERRDFLDAIAELAFFAERADALKGGD